MILLSEIFNNRLLKTRLKIILQQNEKKNKIETIVTKYRFNNHTLP
jgi:hypothetical protein